MNQKGLFTWTGVLILIITVDALVINMGIEKNQKELTEQLTEIQTEISAANEKLDTLAAAAETAQTELDGVSETLEVLDEEVNDLISIYYDENGIVEE